ncbi:MAG: UDP-2,3-diacylglucosamine diphosphatase [Pseudomonadales bacterium]|nr:UDP-2,3-diacylglucosamine diphosphatase [Pseudomonadales bacterium]MDP7359507.1 UDP-2,3-diacylglucosamine diphosphatase [Pseudomonadales bacterium]MDP7594093.1 UDP-2,3-diacylglucosamine diphosphatase [Pseudomonadales bacterium]HJL54047.1 UDP-2,3-diacylglucosamine diphosphatase [Arenicellales bacterium]HJN50359.1 UDP-2,3-diacylglucosamine diphosphatase [Pseudomonadales bacterium]
MTQLFISDLHLDEDQAQITACFLRFLKTEAVGADALYILGDLFEVWLGDDHVSEFNDKIIAALDELSSRDIPVYIMQGNRDFLIGEDFCRGCGAELLPDPTTIDCYGNKVLLMHGDSLCTGDTEYMQARRMLRTPEFQQQLLAKSLDERALIAQNARQESMQHTAELANDIMDVTANEVIEAMQQAGVDLMIHGHTHRPAIHPLLIEDQPAVRIVLGNWHTKGWLLRFEPSGYELESFPIARSD